MQEEAPSEPEQTISPLGLFDRLLTLKDVALILNLSERSVRRIIQAGDLPAIRIGGSPRIRSADLRAFIDSAPAYYLGGGGEE